MAIFAIIFIIFDKKAVCTLKVSTTVAKGWNIFFKCFQTVLESFLNVWMAKLPPLFNPSLNDLLNVFLEMSSG